MSQSIRDKSGIYHWPPPWIEAPMREQFPSVTTVLDETSGSDIAFAYLWFADQAKQELIEAHRAGHKGHLWKYTEDDAHEEGGFWTKEEADPIDILAQPGYMKTAALQKMRAAADRGLTTEDIFSGWLIEPFGIEKVRERIELAILTNQRCCSVDEVLPYAIAVHAWLEKMRPEALSLQTMVFSRKHGYAGRRDALLKFDGFTWVVDLKTRTKNQARRTDGKQLGAYWGAEFEGESEGPIWKETALDGRRRIGLLIATPERCGFRAFEDPKHKFRQFLHHLALWHSERDGKLLPLRTPKAKAVRVADLSAA